MCYIIATNLLIVALTVLAPTQVRLALFLLMSHLICYGWNQKIAERAYAIFKGQTGLEKKGPGV